MDLENESEIVEDRESSKQHEQVYDMTQNNSSLEDIYPYENLGLTSYILNKYEKIQGRKRLME